MTTKVLLDTDIGSDIDDAVCLAYLLANPDCDLLGITTVSGEAEKRAQIASALCVAAGKDVPIYPGAADPLINAQLQPIAQQAAALSKWPHRTEFPRGQAVEFLRQTIRAHPREIILLTIGPLTNIALLFRVDAEIPSLLRGMVSMCGLFTGQSAISGPLEWNALLDVHATAIVYRTRLPFHRSIGLDVTEQVRLSSDEVRQRFQPPLLRVVLDFAEVWFQERPCLTFHDPLAAATIFDPEICRFERGRVDPELADPKAIGQTRWQPHPDGPHEVALQVDPQRFFAHYFSVFG